MTLIAQFKGFQCSADCSHCCYDNPHGVSALEVRRIIPKLHAQQKKQIETRYRKWRLFVHKEPQHRQKAWKKQRQPCPLLQSGRCSVYDVRPLACRSFFSLNSPDWCHPHHPNHQKNPQIGHDDIQFLLEKISIQRGWLGSHDLISGLFQQIQEKEP